MRENIYYIKLSTINTDRILHTLYKKAKLISVIREKALKYNVLIYGYMIDVDLIQILISGENKSIKDFLGEVNGAFSNFYSSKETYMKSVFKENFYYLKLKNKKEMIGVINYIHSNRNYRSTYDIISEPNSYHEYMNTSQFNLINQDIKEAYSSRVQSKESCSEEYRPECVNLDTFPHKKFKKTVLNRILVCESNENIGELLVDEGSTYSI